MRQKENSGWVGGVRVSARFVFLSLGSILSARAHQFDVIVEENALSRTVQIPYTGARSQAPQEADQTDQPEH